MSDVTHTLQAVENGDAIAANQLLAGKPTSLSPKQVILGLTILLHSMAGAAAIGLALEPTFSDANWTAIGAIPGTDGTVYAVVADGSADIYIGGDFTKVGDVIANRIARWDGTRWSALDSGLGGDYAAVYALTVSGRLILTAGDHLLAVRGKGHRHDRS
jgi:hypothetical protein